MFDEYDRVFDALALTFLLSFVLLGVVLLVWLGSLPGSIAARRKHPQADAITACGWLGLLVFVLWPIAMVWAFTRVGPVAGAEKAPEEVRP